MGQLSPPDISRRHYLKGALALGMCAAASLVRGAAPLAIIFPQYLSAYNSRYDYDWAVLRMALEKTVASHGPFTMHQSEETWSPQRVYLDMRLPQGRINVMARPAAPEFERTFLPVRIPIDRGLLGFRVFLVRADDLARFAAVRSLHDLRKLRAGLGKGWVDIEVLRAAGIEVIEGSNYQSLYTMLMAGRFDFFSRGVDEAPWEFSTRKEQFPQMAIEPTLMLRYPLPRYLYVRRNADGAQLARRLQAGLEIMVQDGALQALFTKYKGPSIEILHLARRRMLSLTNPVLSPETPLHRPELWFTPHGAKT